MQSADLVPKRSYAWCESPRVTIPSLVRVKFIGPARSGKAKIRWEEGELSGLDDWVSTRQLLCLWKERKACLRDRERQARLDQDSDEAFDRVVENAISHVLTATGEEGGFIRAWTLPPDKADRLWQRAQLRDDPRHEPLAFIDRFGELHLGYRSALRFAKAFAAAEPEPCVHLIERWEQELRAEGYLPGASWHHEFLREERPAYALVRQWAGTGVIETLKGEIERLQRLVSQAEGWLRSAGDPRHADALKRGLHGR
jgi:hypothetical protein